MRKPPERPGLPGLARFCAFPALVLALGIVSGCAPYAPLPLASAPPEAAPADLALLQREAAALQRPFLRPVTIDLAAPLTGDAIAVIAVIGNPDLKALRAQTGVAEAQAMAAGLLPDPTFSIGADKVISGPDPFVNIAGALGLDLNALRTRGAVRAGARASAAQARLDLAWSEWQTACLARQQALRVRALTAQTVLLETSAASAHRLLERTQSAAGRGDLSADQLQSARAAAFDAGERLRTAKGDLDTARAALNCLLGLPPTQMLSLAPEAAVSALLPESAALFGQAMASRADLAALRAGYDAEEAAVRKAVLDQFPALGLTLNSSRDTAGNHTLGPALDFTLPLWNRGRGGIAVERATREALRVEYEGRLHQTRADIADALAGIALARAERAKIGEELPGLERYAQSAQQAAARGDVSLASAEAAAQALRDRQYQDAQAEQDEGERMIALELLTGHLREGWQ